MLIFKRYEHVDEEGWIPAEQILDALHKAVNVWLTDSYWCSPWRI